jgi:organic radical activating enzyme
MKEIRITKPHDNHQTVTEHTIAEIKAKGLNRFMGWACTVGLECLYIDFDGMVWRGPCRVGGPLGHMLTDWQLPETMAKCTRQTCDCGTGIKLVKFSPDYRADPIEEQVFNVQWDLGRRCNYDCSYCWPSSHNKTDTWLPFKALKKVVDKIFENYEGKMQFNFAGGEPTLHPEFLELCTYIWEKGHNIHVQTNGTMNVIKARKLANIAEISISVHFEFVNYEKLINNIRAILSAGNRLEVKMMIDSTNKSFYAALDFKRYLENIPHIQLARVIMSPLRDPVTNDLMNYTEWQRGHFGDVEF